MIDIFKEVDTSKIVNKVISPQEGLVKTAYVVDKIIEKVREYPKPPKTK